MRLEMNTTRINTATARPANSGFGAEVSGDSSSASSVFGQMYQQIAGANQTARQNGVLTSAISGVGNQDDVLALLAQTLGAAGEKADSVGTVQASSLADANAMIRDALTTLSKELHLNVSDDLDSLDIKNFTSDIRDQFAQILSALKGIADLMAQMAQSGQSVSINGMTFEGGQLIRGESIIKTQVFNIEMALQAAGVGADVAKKQDNLLGNGIMQATDPATKSMPLGQIPRAIHELVNSAMEEVKNLLHRFKNLMNGQDPVVAGSTATSGEKTDPLSNDLKLFGAIKKEHHRTKDTGVVMTEADALSAADKQIAAHQIKAIFLRSNEFGPDFAEGVQLVSSGGADSSTAMLSALQPKISHPLMRGIDEMVMNQIVEKFHLALRTGANEMKITLRPESLGEIQLKISVDGDVVMARIAVENQQVKQIVENNLQSLKDSLAQHNLQTGSFDVNVRHHSQGQMDGDLEQNGSPDGPATDSAGLEDDNPAGQLSPAVQMGFETGRRFGSNSMEYFA